jgi:hypothetical protein
MYNGSQTLIATFDPQNKMSVSIDTVLNAGTYYIVVDGTGNLNTSNYGSLGSYKLTGITGPLPIHSVTLAGNSLKEKHNLHWTTISDDAIKSQDIEFSENGIEFKELTTISPTINAFSYTPTNASILYYRIKVTSVLNQTMYSNVISLRVTWRTNIFTVSSLIRNDISVTASEDYQYRLFDANGRLISKGNGTKGINTININNRSAGLYIIQLLSSDNQRQTERIIKQ